jgi:hypothetical protein
MRLRWCYAKHRKERQRKVDEVKLSSRILTHIASNGASSTHKYEL